MITIDELNNKFTGDYKFEFSRNGFDTDIRLIVTFHKFIDNGTKVVVSWSQFSKKFVGCKGLGWNLYREYFVRLNKGKFNPTDKTWTIPTCEFLHYTITEGKPEKDGYHKV